MSVLIRTATSEDAQAVADHHHGIALESDIDVPLRPHDMPADLESIASYIERYIEPDNSTAVVAEADGKIVGWVTALGGKSRMTRHVVEIGLAISRDWRGQGIGTRLMEAVIAWAHDTQIVRRIELDVYTTNSAAIKLYEKLGFVREGCRQKALLHDEHYVDLYHMALLI